MASVMVGDGALLRAKAINDPLRNPYLRKEWNPDFIRDHVTTMPMSVREPWARAISHLQSIAWRLHSISCETPGCLGCANTWSKEVEVRPYFHQKQAEFICYDGKEGWLITGRRFGKTDAGVFSVICRLLGYNPLTNELTYVPQTWWIVGLDFPMVRDALIPMFKKYMPPESVSWTSDGKEAWHLAKTDMIATIFNGSSCGFKSADSGAGKFQSVERDGIHFDEESDRDVYWESRMRIAGGKRLLIRGSMTPDPMRGLSWTYKEILKNEDRQRDPDDLRVWTGSIHENPGISRVEIAALEAQMEPWEQEVRLKGNYDIGRGRCAFSVERLRDMLLQSTAPVKTEPGINWDLKVWKDPLPLASYVIGADPAEGLEHGDNSVAQVLRRDGGAKIEQVATMAGKIDPDLFGYGLVRLAKRYNQAWIMVEANNHGFAVISAIRRLGYPYVYSQKADGNIGETENKKWGWITSAITRPLLVDEVARAIRDEQLAINDSDTIDEMMTFVIGPDGKAEARSGCKDDRVMSIGIALQAHIRCPFYETPQPVVKKEFTLDQKRTMVVNGMFFGGENPQYNRDWMTS